jgi:cyanobactin maturation PatA/PatG family protease
VFALGQLGFDYGTEARRDSIRQHMSGTADPHDANQLLAYLERNPSDAASIIWTLSLDATPIYAIEPHGAFASDTYKLLRQFLREQLGEAVERVSIPGHVSGSARLFNGQVVPVIHPEPRGLFNWTTAALVEAVAGKPLPADAKQTAKEAYNKNRQSVENFLRRIYDELRNLGATPQERALNYSATNALLVENVFRDAIKEQMDLDTIAVERSPICRPESDCWDVKLTFFDPEKIFQRGRKMYRFAVDVSDVVPVMVGPVRSWFVR